MTARLSTLVVGAALAMGSVFPSAGAAQVRWQLGVDGILGLPRGEFGDNIESNAIGISGFVTRRIGNTPLHLGLEASLLEYGEESRMQPLFTAIPEITVKVSTANQVVLAHFLTRVQPATGRLRPYLEGYVGLNYLFTRSSVEGDSDETLASSTNFADWTSSLGVGGGILLPLVTRDTPEGERDFELHLEARARYLFGGRAEYLTEGLLIDDEGDLRLEPRESRTDILVVHFGVAFHF